MLTEATEVVKVLDQSLLPKNSDPKLKLLAELRWISQTTGIVHPQQVKWLILLANLVFGDDKAVISISPESSFIKVESNGDASTITERYPEAIKYILGEGWTVQMCYNVKHESSKTGRKGNRSKLKRKKRARAVRKKS